MTIDADQALAIGLVEERAKIADQAALDAHGKTDYFRAAGPKLGPCLAGAPEVEYLDAV